MKSTSVKKGTMVVSYMFLMIMSNVKLLNKSCDEGFFDFRYLTFTLIMIMNAGPLCDWSVLGMYSFTGVQISNQ